MLLKELYLKFGSNSNLILDVFPPVFLSKFICVASSHSSRLMVNTTFSKMDEVIWVGAMPEFVHQDRVELIGNGGVHKHSCALKSLLILNTGSIATFLSTSLNACLK